MQTKERQLTTADLFIVLRRALLLIVACALLGGAVSYWLAKRRASVTYTASSAVYVQASTVDMEVGPTSNEIALARALALSCCDAIKNDALCNNIKAYFAQRAGDGWPDISHIDNNTLSAMITATTETNSQNVAITVTASDGRLAILLANAVADEMEASMVDIIGHCVITPASWAQVATATSTFSPTLAIVGVPVGAFGAYALVLLLYILDPRVRDRKELVELYEDELPLLGTIEAAQTSARCLLTEDVPAAMREAYNRTRVNLLSRVDLGHDRLTERETPVIGITTALEHEGRRHLAANLALSFAQLGLRTLLIDADYRAGEGLDALLHVQGGEGMAAVAAGKQAAPVCVGSSTLFFMPRGSIAGNPADFVGSQSFFLAVNELRANYDAIFVSLPPVTAYADAATAAPALGGVVLGAVPGVDKRRDLSCAIDTMKNVGLPLYGMVACAE